MTEVVAMDNELIIIRADWNVALNTKIYTTVRYGQRAFGFVAPSLGNALPGGIRESDSIQSFKASSKTLFFNCN